MPLPSKWSALLYGLMSSTSLYALEADGRRVYRGVRPGPGWEGHGLMQRMLLTLRGGALRRREGVVEEVEPDQVRASGDRQLDPGRVVAAEEARAAGLGELRVVGDRDRAGELRLDRHLLVDDQVGVGARLHDDAIAGIRRGDRIADLHVAARADRQGGLCMGERARAGDGE